MARAMRREAFAVAWIQGTQVINERRPAEYTGGYVPRVQPSSLRTMPARRGELPAGRLELDIRASSNRSKAVADSMNSHGIEAYPAAGGTGAWARSDPRVAAGPYEHAG